MSVLQQTKPTPYDRLGLTLCIALLIHALIVFGVTFTKEDRPNMRFNTMDIICLLYTSDAADE